MLGINPYERFRQNNSNNTSNTLSSSRINGNFNQDPQRENLGSYRVANYQDEELPTAALITVTPVWKEINPNSIVAKEKTLHLSLTELRVEDYFMIRTNKLEPKQAKSVENRINSQCFNGDLLKNGCYNLLPFSRDRPVDLDTLRNQNLSNNNSSFSSNFNNINSVSNSPNQTYNNAFSRNINSQTNNQASSNQTTGNIFSRNSSNNSSGSNGNPFLGSPNGNVSNSSNGNVSNSSNGNVSNSSNGNESNSSNGNVSNSSIKGGNIFNGQQATNSSNNNIFSNNSVNSSNNGNRATGSNNIFSNNASNGNNSMNSSNNTSNAFNNFGGGVNSNNTNNSNAQQQGSNGNQITGNSMQNNNSSKPFNQNNNNVSSNTSSNQLFANNSANLNNLLGNNQQNGSQALGRTSNNIFNNNQNGSAPNQNLNNLAQGQQFQSSYQANTSLFSNNNNFNPNLGQPFNSMDMLNGNTLEFLNTQALFFNGIMKEIEQRVIQKVSPFEQQRRQSYYGFNSIHQQQPYSRQSQLHQQPFFSIPLSKNRQEEQVIIVAVIAEKRHQEVPQKSQIYPQHFNSKKNQKSNLKQSNLLPIQSRVSNYQEECFKSMKIDQISQTKKCKSILFQNAQTGPKECCVRLEVKWMDKIKQKPSQRMTLAKAGIHLPYLDISSQQGLELLVVSLKEIFPIIRNDAKIIINHNLSDFNSSEIVLVGTIEQFFINLHPKEYQVFFSPIENGHIHSLTIMKFKNGNKTATISWDAPIEYEDLDFSVHTFNLQLSEVICNVPALNSRCRITFEALPQRISKIFNSIGKTAAAASLRSFIQGKNQEEKLFQFCSLYDDGSWTFLVQKFN